MTFHDCMCPPWKSGLIELGASPPARAVAAALSRRMLPANVSGVASGGFEVVGVTALATG